MSIPKYADWQNRYKIFSQNWPISTKVAREAISDDIRKYETEVTTAAKRIAAKSMLDHVDAFEKLWKRDSIYPIPKEIAELRTAAQIVSGAIVSGHKYDYACCIAYKVGTSKFDPTYWVQENINGVQWYQGRLVQYDGNLDDEADRTLRCSWMKAAINQAYSSYYAKHFNDPIDAKTLKIFMAPEFFFRGKDGAYDISFFPTIVNEMRGLTKDTKFKDWLFVLGTVIAATFTGKVYLVCTECRQFVEWGNRQDYNAKGFTYVGMDPSGKQTFACPGLPTAVDSQRKACTPGSVIEIPDKAIIDNMALILKGGEDSEESFRYVQKETVSAIDFRRQVTNRGVKRGKAVTGYDNMQLFNNDWSKKQGRKIEVMGRVVTALPSPGAQDVSIPNFDQRPTDSKDESKSGGSLFTIDGIKFGLEICVDHTNGRRLQPTAGVQIQLVPSAGAHIAHFVCRPGGIAFNVDGSSAEGTCNVLINTTGNPQNSGAPDHTSGGAPAGGQAGTEIILYEPSPIPWT
ncbi:hypothetical protein [Terracidiphilus gabretensis]|uniref:hypothetical protein n=1 Tax=Terracidiphilus gabretensis TaxID=1577687 RepID=UPI00071B329A|nr:hypothetical protein [Terracidiphilus gabretensis]